MMEEMMMAMMMGEMMGGFDDMESGFGFSMPPGFGGKSKKNKSKANAKK